MKIIRDQLLVISLALGCVGILVIADAFDVCNLAAILCLVITPAFAGALLGWRIELRGLWLPLYCLVLMVILAQMGVPPYQSSGFGWIIPTTVYTMYITPAAMVSTAITTAVRRRFKQESNKHANTASHVTALPRRP